MIGFKNTTPRHTSGLLKGWLLRGFSIPFSRRFKQKIGKKMGLGIENLVGDDPFYNSGIHLLLLRIILIYNFDCIRGEDPYWSSIYNLYNIRKIFWSLAQIFLFGKRCIISVKEVANPVKHDIWHFVFYEHNRCHTVWLILRVRTGRFIYNTKFFSTDCSS